MDASALGWKEALFVAVLIIALYLGYALLRLSRPRSVTPSPVADADTAVLRGVQTELAGVRAELVELHTRLDLLAAEVERLKSARAVSPQYNDALSAAQQGMSAAQIAERCGISVGEAELICALAGTQGAHKGGNR